MAATLASTQSEGDKIGAGMICSVLLHGMVLLLVLFGLPELLPPPVDEPEPIVVEVETISEKTAPPPRQVESPKPVEEPPAVVPLPPEPEVKSLPLPPEPKPLPPPPKPPEPKPPEPKPPEPKPIPPEPEPAPIPKPKPPEPVKEPVKPPPDLLKDVKPPPKKPPPPPDDFDNLLKSVDKMRQTSKPTAPPTPTPPAAAAKTVNSPVTDLSSQPTATERDFVASQIWPRWNVDLGAKGAETLRVGVKISVLPDGRVTSADLDVDRGRYESDSFYRAAADAAKRAVLSASPLKVPATRPNLFRDNPQMTINFDPRSMVR